MRRFLATLLVTAVAAVAAAGSAAAAPRPFDAGQRLCTAQGGFFISRSATSYECFSSGVPFSEGQLLAARAVCENAYGGFFVFEPFGGPFELPIYRCLGTS